MAPQVATSVQEVIDWHEAQYGRLQKPLHLWFRGISNERYELTPKSLRPEWKANETSRLLSFKMQAPTRYSRCPLNDDLIGWLSLMQHYGLPTRLLDWSESILVGLYFAVEPSEFSGQSDDNADAAVWSLCPELLNNFTLTKLGRESFYAPIPFSTLAEKSNTKVMPRIELYGPMVEQAFGITDELTDAVLAVGPDHVDLRLTMQQAMFTIHGRNAQPLDSSVYRGIDMNKLIVPSAFKWAIFNQLAHIGTTRASIFPDLENLAKYITVASKQ
jgi:hypothetical protein